MDSTVVKALEELTTCSFCKSRFNDSDHLPKFLGCKHFFCLECIQRDFLKGRDAYCVSCWNRTTLKEDGLESLETHASILVLVNNLHQIKLASSGGSGFHDKEPKVSENCTTHGMPHVSWCPACQQSLCRVCAQEHGSSSGHKVRSLRDATEQMSGQLQMEVATVSKLMSEIHRLEKQQQDFLLKVLEACTTLKCDIENELKNGPSSVHEAGEVQELIGTAKRCVQSMEIPSTAQAFHSALISRKQKLQTRYQELLLQNQMDDLISNSNIIYDFPSLKQVLQSLAQNKIPSMYMNVPNVSQKDPILFLANYCLSRLYPRHIMTESHLKQNGTLEPPPPPPPLSSASTLLALSQQSQTPSHLVPTKPHPHFLSRQEKIISPPTNSSITRPTSSYPLFFFSIDMNGVMVGRIVIETRPDVAPKMVENFQCLSTCERGFGYKGCSVFQCWKGESLITGDFEYNNGRGGYSIFEEPYFMPDDTKLPAVRGAVGMRRTQKRHDSKGLVGSQFRIILQDMPGFTAIFGRVIEGLDIMDQLSQYGDNAGMPTKPVAIVNCGKL